MSLEPVLVVLWPLLRPPVLLHLGFFPLVPLFLSVMLLQSMLLPLVDGGQRHLLAKGKSSELWFYGLQIVHLQLLCYLISWLIRLTYVVQSAL